MHTESFSMEVPALEEVAKSLKEKRPAARAALPTPWFLVGNGGMDPHDSPLSFPYSSSKNPFLHSLRRTSQTIHLNPKTLNPKTLNP